MHPTLELLLALRDGEATAETSVHVAHCRECAAEVERLRGTAAALRSLPEMRPPRDLWPAVKREIEARRRRRRMEWMGGAALAIAASLTLVVLAPGAFRQVPNRRPAVASTAYDSRELDSLVRRSQRLEDELRRYEPEGRVIDASSANTVAEIEDSIAVIDSRLSQAATRKVGHDEVIRLWRDRVKLMGDLVEAHDARPIYAGL